MVKLKAYGWLLLATIFWGTAFPSSEWATEQVPHTVAVFFRFGGGAIVLIVLTLVMQRSKGVSRAQIMRAAIAGLVGVFAYNSVFFLGVTMAPAADGGILFPALTPVIATCVLIFSGRESAPPRRIIGLTLGVLAAVGFFVATSRRTGGDTRRLLGDGPVRRRCRDLVDVHAAQQEGTGEYGPAVVHHPRHDRRLAAARDRCRSGVRQGPLGWPVRRFWLNAVWLAIASTALAYILFARGIRDVGAGPAATMMFATAFSYAFLHQSLSWAQGIAAVVMLAGAFIAATSHSRATPPAASVDAEVADDLLPETVPRRCLADAPHTHGTTYGSRRCRRRPAHEVMSVSSIPAPRTTDQAAFDQLFAVGRTAVLDGTHRCQERPVDDSPRWGISALMRPDRSAANILDQITLLATAAAGGAHWTSGAAVSSHLTLRSLEPFRSHVPVNDPLVDRYAVALRSAAAGIGPIRFAVTGLTLTPHSVMACAVPVDSSADDLAAAYADALGSDGWHEGEFKRDFWYLNLVHFAEPIPRPSELIDFVADRRTAEIANLLVAQIQIVQWRHSEIGMLPITHASITPLRG